jgi:choice-of-anchor A domain-containing protein
VFTLSGTATTSFIINVTGNFSLSGGSKISLANVPAANVLFNIRNSGNMFAFSGGLSMYGTLLATKRLVGLDPGFIYGRVIANAVKITSGGQVIIH